MAAFDKIQCYTSPSSAFIPKHIEFFHTRLNKEGTWQRLSDDDAPSMWAITKEHGCLWMYHNGEWVRVSKYYDWQSRILYVYTYGRFYTNGYAVCGYVDYQPFEFSCKFAVNGYDKKDLLYSSNNSQTLVTHIYTQNGNVYMRTRYMEWDKTEMIATGVQKSNSTSAADIKWNTLKVTAPVGSRLNVTCVCNGVTKSGFSLYSNGNSYANQGDAHLGNDGLYFTDNIVISTSDLSGNRIQKTIPVNRTEFPGGPDTATHSKSGLYRGLHWNYEVESYKEFY